MLFAAIQLELIRYVTKYRPKQGTKTLQMHSGARVGTGCCIISPRMRQNPLFLASCHILAHLGPLKTERVAQATTNTCQLGFGGG